MSETELFEIINKIVSFVKDPSEKSKSVRILWLTQTFRNNGFDGLEPNQFAFYLMRFANEIDSAGYNNQTSVVEELE